MRHTKFYIYLFLALILIGSALIIQAKGAPTGQIKGKLTDQKTGDPIVGASVMVDGTTFGAMSDFDGIFRIYKLVPGYYRLVVTHLDYTKTIIDSVEIRSDLTTEQNCQMVRKVSELKDEITVTAKKDVIDKFVVTNEAERSEIKSYVRGAQPSNLAQVQVDGIQKVKRRPYPPQPGDYIPGHYPPAHGGTQIVNGEAFDAMFFKNYGVNPFVDTEDDHLSTFATDVDDASYIMMRSYLERGELPPNEAIRVEEFINHFDYNYNPPRYETFNVNIEGSPSYFGENSQLLKIGIKGKEIRPEDRKDANLVFVIDVSGSMGRENRLGLVKKALNLLVYELNANDRVGIVIYGSRGKVLLEPTSIRHRQRILDAIEWLIPEGSTNADEGLRLAYKMADRMYEPGKINRIILCSDGVANVGRTGPDQILKQIKRYAEKGITLSAIGFGMGNYNDILMEKLGNKGNGSYAYVDDISEAKRIFIDNLTGNLQVIARDVKIQVDFNPEVVRSYRLLGYENRDVDDDKFRDDKEDGGEIGAGHEVTALYEIKLHKNVRRGDIGTVYIRYKDPDYVEEVSEINYTMTTRVFEKSFEQTTPEFQLAACAAEFSEILRKSYWAKGSKPEDVLKVASRLLGDLQDDDIIEFISLVAKSKKHQEKLARK